MNFLVKVNKAPYKTWQEANISSKVSFINFFIQWSCTWSPFDDLSTTPFPLSKWPWWPKNT